MSTSPVKIWRRQKEIRNLLNRKGKIISWTYIYAPPIDFKKNAPYPVVLVEFKKGERAFGQLVSTQINDIKIGIRVKSVLRKVRDVLSDDVIAYGLKFERI